MFGCFARRPIARLVPAAMLGMIVSQARADFQITTIAPPGSVSSSAYGVNDAGQITGTYDDSNGVTHGFVLTGSSFDTFDFPGSGFFDVRSINNAGQVVGMVADSNFNMSGYVKTGSSVSTFRVNGRDTTASGINNNGDLTGHTLGSSGSIFGFTRISGVVSTFQAVSGVSTYAGGINDLGWVTGYTSTDVDHSFVKIGNSYTFFDVPGASATDAHAIDNLGRIVGTYSGADSNLHGFLKDGSTFTTIDVPGADSTMLYGINNLGQITGTYQTADFVSHGFIATPSAVPEPTSVVSSVVGLSLLGLTFARSRLTTSRSTEAR